MPSGAYDSVNDKTLHPVANPHGEVVPVYIQFALISRSMDMVNAVYNWIYMRVPELVKEPAQVTVSFCKNKQEEIAWVDYQSISLSSIDRDYVDWATGLLVCKPCLGTGRVRREGASRPPWSLCPDCSGRGRSIRSIVDIQPPAP